MRNLNFKLFGDAQASSLLLCFGWSVFIFEFFRKGNIIAKYIDGQGKCNG